MAIPFETLVRPSYDGRMLGNPFVIQIPYLLRLLGDAVIRENHPEEVCQEQLQDEGFSRFRLGSRKVKHQLRETLEGWQRITEGLSDVVKSCAPHGFCNRCASCFLFGSLGSVGKHRVNYSLGHRVRAADALSIQPATTITQRTTNQVDPLTRNTGSALTTNYLVPRSTVFYGVLTLIDPTEDSLKLVLGLLRSVTRIGANTATFGDCEIEVLGLRGGLIAHTGLTAARMVVGRTLDEIREEAKRLSNLPMDRAHLDLDDLDAVTSAVLRLNQDISAVIRGVSASAERAQEAKNGLTEALAGLEGATQASDRLKAVKTLEAALSKGLKDTHRTSLAEALELDAEATELKEIHASLKSALKGADFTAGYPEAVEDVREALASILGMAPDMAGMDV